jgi:general nucleoside transport system permease protein
VVALWIMGSLRGATSLMFAALGGVVSERSGVVNIGLEGMMLAGAFAGALGALLTGSAAAGIAIGVLAGGLLALAHAFFALTLKVDQVISGMALNLTALGLTSFLLRKVSSAVADFQKIPSAPPWVLTGVAIVLTVGLWWWLRGSVGGLRLQAVGHDARKASRAGVHPIRVRYGAVIGSGMLAGLGGAFLSVAQTPGFSENMTSGRGYIALAAVVLGRWSPLGAAGACVGFGLLYQMEEWMQGTPILGVQLPSEFWLSLPYLLTAVALAGFLGRSRPPGDLGRTL